MSVAELRELWDMGSLVVVSHGRDGSRPFGPLRDSVEQQLSLKEKYPLVNQRNYGKSPFLMGKSTINGHVQ